MTGLPLDTHAWFWFLSGSKCLPDTIRQRIVVTAEVAASSASVYEIGQKIRTGHWPGMDADALDAMIADENVRVLDLSAAALRLASLLDWAHRDPFDRMIGAVALGQGMTLVSSDSTFDSVP